jgi:anti-sigma factor RsiW
VNWSEPIDSFEDLRIEAYVDGELSAEERSAFQAELAVDADLRRQVAFADDLRKTLRRLPSERMPASVTASVLSTARRQSRSDVLTRIRSWFLPGFADAWQPALAMATLMLLVAISVRVTVPSPATDPAVAQALEQVKWTLAFLSEVSSETGETVRGTVIGPHVIAPMQGAVDQAFSGPAVQN